MEAFIRGLPKAEMHLHIEGTLEPELMFEMARRNNVPLRFGSVSEVRAAYEFSDLQSFLDIYYEGASVLLNEQDFFDLTIAYFERVAPQGVRHAEIFFDPQTHTERDVPFATVIAGIRRAQEEAEERLGITSLLIVCFLRHLSGEAAVATLEEALPFKEWISAVGLDSSEVGNPPELFAGAYDLARAEGLLTVAHAGEEGPPEYVWGALDALHVARIDHGVRAAEDPALLDRLVAEQIALTMCPLSNVKLRVFDRLEDHNLKQLLDRGVRVTINSDDPAYFGGYILENYVATQAALGLTKDEVVQIARNSFLAAFIDEDHRARLLQELDDYVAASG